MRRRLGIVLVAVALVGAACGDDDTGEVVLTAAAPTSTTASAADESPVTTDPSDVVSAGPDGGAARTGSMVLLADDFQDRDAEGWDIDYGWYLFGSGMDIGMAASQSAWMWWPDGEEWDTGYVLRASVRVDEGGLAVATAVGPEGRYVVHLHEDGTDVLIDRPWGTFETLATAAPVTLGAWHALAIGIQDDLVHVYVDGEPLVAAVADHLLQAGSVGFGALDGSLVAFDNVYVTVLRGQLPNLALSDPADPSALAAPEVEEPPDDGGGDDANGGGGDDPPEDDGDGDGPPDDGLPNLKGAFVWFQDIHVVAGEPVEVAFNVENTGTVRAGPFEVSWEALGSACTALVGGVEPLKQANGICTAPALPAGLHTWTAHVDHDERIAESDETDNVVSGQITVTVVGPDLPDLVVGATRATNEPIELDYDFWVIVTDQNEVGFHESYTTRFLVDGQSVCSVDVDGEFRQPRCLLTGLSPGPHVLEVIIDAAFDIIESREDNNTFTWEFTVAG